MNPRQRYTLNGFGAVVAIFTLGWLFWLVEKPSGKISLATLDVPIVMHTDGGRLEVATVTAMESFKFDAPPKSILGVDLGNTVSHIQAKVVYRYHIEMAKKWPIRFQGNTAVVEAGEIKPTLPVAFDTSTMQAQTTSGWARFDKHENLAALERQISPELERRSNGYKPLTLVAARKSVADFARTWLSGQQQFKALKITDVKVIFPGDPAISGTTLRPSAADQ